MTLPRSNKLTFLSVAAIAVLAASAVLSSAKPAPRGTETAPTARATPSTKASAEPSQTAAQDTSAAPTGTSTAPSPSGRARIEQRWQPQIAGLRDKLEKLKRKQPTLENPNAIEKRISELEQRVGRIEKHVETTAQRVQALRETRPERRAQALSTLEQRFGKSSLTRRDVRAELARHARRVARLKQVIHVAEGSSNEAAEKRARKLLSREGARHEKAMSGLVPGAKRPSPAGTGGHQK